MKAGLKDSWIRFAQSWTMARTLGLLLLIIGLAGLIDGPLPYLPIPGLSRFHRNCSSELFGIGLAALIIDSAYERRGKQRFKQQLIREIGSTDNGIALRAARELDASGWLENGALEGTYLWGANLQGVVLQDADLRKALLAYTNLQRANLLAVDLREAFLRGSNMQEARLWGAKLQLADLREVNLQGALLSGANLQEADLRDANMQGADLLGANLQRADLRRAKLKGANLQRAKLDGANLQQVDLGGQRGLLRDQLAEVYGLRLTTMPDGSLYNGCFNLRGDIEEAHRDGVDPNAPAAMAEWYGVSLEEGEEGEYEGGQARTLEHLLIERNGKMVDYDVVLKKVEPLLVAATREVLPFYDDIGHLFREVYTHLRRQGIWPGGTHMAIYYATEHPRRNVDQEAAVPVPEGVPGSRRVTVRELPGVEMMATLLHQGSFDDLGKTYTALEIWIKVNGYRIAGPIREVYLRGPGSGVDPSSYLTEVQFPVEKA